MLTFNIPNMTCGGCAKSVTNALRSVDPDARIETDPATRKVSVNSTTDERDFLAVLEEAGYPHQK
ncbi:heavy-metal-associated domain-containing protein [Pseudomonas sp. UM16]|uniref:heavy-metal-associated domain-containing protein n=1 Tax=Pseudomonas sp. UM16 TaxID=3158962 RepID=UPI00398FC469